MRPTKSVKTLFLTRHHRFVATVEQGGESFEVRVPNTGRLKELLFPGNEVLLEKSSAGSRYPYFISEAKKDDYFVSIDSLLPNRLMASYLARRAGEGESLKREVRLPSGSRLDFQLGDAFWEVKGVTLEEQGIARFPDAPTRRGIRHLKELTALSLQGKPAVIAFVILVRARAFQANPADSDYQQALHEAFSQGVQLKALRFERDPCWCFVEELPFLPFKEY